MKIFLSGIVMGVETPIPPFMMNAAAPTGRPRGGSMKENAETALPRRASESVHGCQATGTYGYELSIAGPEVGNPHKKYGSFIVWLSTFVRVCFKRV